MKSPHSQHFIRHVYQVDSSYLVHYQSVRKFDKNASLIVAKGGGRRGVLGDGAPHPTLSAIVFHLVVIYLLFFRVKLARKYYNQRLD